MPKKYEEALKKLNDQQLQAVIQIDGPMLVIAGPGTGKTQLLTTRVAHILSSVDVLPQNILCLTFTESAVETMRERLKGIIGKSAYDVMISTYHGFGSELIRRYPDYFEGYAGRRPLDDLTIYTILRQILASLPYDNLLRYPDIYLSDIKTLISDSKKALLAPSDIRAIAASNSAYLEKADPVVTKILKDFVRIDKKSFPIFEKLYILLGKLGAGKKPKAKGPVEPFGKILLESLGGALEEAALAGNNKSLTSWKNNWLEKDSKNNFVIGSQKVQRKIHDFAVVYDLYNQELKERGFYDYDDMILASIEALRKNSDFRYTLQEQYQYLLLDEFQDTNEAQFKLVEMLTDNPVNEGRPNVMAVGDDDQAIYSFQGANYSHMLNFQKMYKNVALVSLTKNYRSTPDILFTAGNIANQIEERLQSNIKDISKKLTAERKPESNSVIERWQADSDVSQFGWIAKKIKGSIDNGIRPKDIAVIAPQHKYLEPLTEYLSQLQIPMRYEKSENVLDDRAIGQLITMSQLVLAIGGGQYELADSLWPEILSYDFWDLPTSKIWQISWQANDKKESWTNILLSIDQLRTIALFFIRLGVICNNEPLEVMLDYLIGSAPISIKENDDIADYNSPFYGYYFGQPASSMGIISSVAENTDTNRLGTFWQLLTNLTILRTRLRDFRVDEKPTLYLSDFVDFVNAHKAANIKILNSSPHQESENAVQLLTAFKAKGQEYKVVFVVACVDEAWGTKARGLGNRISLPPNMEYIRYGGVTNDERIRLFYVALTRARSQLYLVNYTSTYSGKRSAPLTYLEETTSSDGLTFSPMLPESFAEVLAIQDSSRPPEATELTAFWRLRHHLEISQQMSRSMLRARLGNYQLNPTDLGEFIDVEHAGPEAFFMYKLLRFPRAPTADIRYGNAIHDTLHWIHLYNRRNGSIPTVRKTNDHFTIVLKNQRLSEQVTANYLKRGKHALKAYLTQRGPTISIENECEYGFRNEGVFIGEAHMNGKIDKLIIDRKKKQITVVDYKTGRASRKWERSSKLHKYSMQLYLYKALVEKSHTYAGYKVTDAYVEFVEPAEDGKIHILPISFDNATAQKIDQLAISVWGHIQEIKIPDISGYKADISGIESFEKFLLSGE